MLPKPLVVDSSAGIRPCTCCKAAESRYELSRSLKSLIFVCILCMSPDTGTLDPMWSACSIWLLPTCSFAFSIGETLASGVARLFALAWALAFSGAPVAPGLLWDSSKALRLTLPAVAYGKSS